MLRRVKVYFDGGCRPNPGPIEAAVVVRGSLQVFDDLGTGSNSDAEWQALFCALKVSHVLELTHFELLGDAIEVVRQADLALRTGESANENAARFLEVAELSPPARIRWIKREQNLAGIALNLRHPR